MSFFLYCDIFYLKISYVEDIIGYKKMDLSLTFADLALESSLQHNRSLKFMQKLDSAINWSRVERILLSHYMIGTGGQGADA